MRAFQTWVFGCRLANVSDPLENNPAYRGLTYAADVACVMAIISGIWSIFTARKKIRNGDVRNGKKMLKIAIFMIIAGVVTLLFNLP